MYDDIYYKRVPFTYEFDWETISEGWVIEIFGDDPYDKCIGGGYELPGWSGGMRIDYCCPIGLPPEVEEGAEFNGWRISSNTGNLVFEPVDVNAWAVFVRAPAE